MIGSQRSLKGQRSIGRHIKYCAKCHVKYNHLKFCTSTLVLVGQERGGPMHPLWDLMTLGFLNCQGCPVTDFRCCREKKVAQGVRSAAILDFDAINWKCCEKS